MLMQISVAGRTYTMIAMDERRFLRKGALYFYNLANYSNDIHIVKAFTVISESYGAIRPPVEPEMGE